MKIKINIAKIKISKLSPNIPLKNPNNNPNNLKKNDFKFD